MKKRIYSSPTTRLLPVSTAPVLQVVSPAGMPTSVSDTKVEYGNGPGDSFGSDESVAARHYFNVWDEGDIWEEE